MATVPLPNSIAYLKSVGFQLQIDRLPDVAYFTQSMGMPQVTIPPPAVGSPFSTQMVQGDKVIFDHLTLNFYIDEKMNNYLSIFNWMMAMGFPENYNQYTAGLSAGINNVPGEMAKNYGNGTLSILDHKNSIIRQFEFVDMFPITLSSLPLNSMDTQAAPIEASVTFAYTYYKVLL